MSTLSLLLIWAGLGLLTSLLALAASLKPTGQNTYSWLWLLILGLSASLLGGWLGLWLLGRLFSPATALWVAVLAMCTPGLYRNLRKRLASKMRA